MSLPIPQPQLRVLSLGAGVQSTTVLLMSCRGELPRLDAAVFADTGWEPKAVYRHLEWLEQEAAEYGVPVYRVSAGNIKHDALTAQKAGGTMDRDPEMKAKAKGKGAHSNSGRWASMPYFTLGPNGERGMKKRQCTKEYKLEPIRKKVRELAGYGPRQRIPIGTVEQWIGISIDEQRRARMSDERWRINCYPLIEDVEMSRNGCLDWMESHGYPEPPRSACVGCPFRHNDEWRWLRDNEPESWQEAIEFDAAIRKCGGMRGDVFLHAHRIPLAEVDLRTDCERGQRMLFEGLCPECMT